MGGFDTTILACSSIEWEPGLSEVFQHYLADIGVRAEVETVDFGTFIERRMEHKQILQYMQPMYSDPAGALRICTPEFKFNLSFVDDPVYNEMYQQVTEERDIDRLYEKIKEMDNYTLEMVYFLSMPEPKCYYLWQPWLKNYDGAGCYLGNTLAKHVWIDQELKKSMGY